jgi:tetratricopeptide (TPR) repeat protein
VKRILTILLLSTAIASAQKGIKVDQSFFKDPEFIKSFVASYGALPQVEPKVSEEENQLLADVGELLQSDRKAAPARLLQSLHSKSSPALIFILGTLYFQEGNLPAAEKAFNMAIERHPPFRRAHKNLALLHVQKNDLAAALKPLQKAIQLGESDSNSFGLLAVCYMNKEQFVAAEAAYRQAFLLDPDNKDWKTGLVNALASQNKYQEAATMLDALITEEPGNVNYIDLQANCYLGMEKPLLAATNFEIIRHLGKATDQTLDLLGNIYLDENLFIPALGAFIAAADKSDGNSFDRSLKTAKILSEYGALAEAEKYIKTITDNKALDPDQAIDLDTIKAKVLRSQNRTEEAIALLTSLVERDPLNGEALVEIAKYHERQDDIAKATFYFDRALRVEEAAYTANLGYGQMLVRQNKAAEALPKLKRSLEVKPSDNLEQFIRQVERSARRAAPK